MPKEIEGNPKEILQELGQLFMAFASHVTEDDLNEMKEAYPKAFNFVEAI